MSRLAQLMQVICETRERHSAFIEALPVRDAGIPGARRFPFEHPEGRGEDEARLEAIADEAFDAFFQKNPTETVRLTLHGHEALHGQPLGELDQQPYSRFSRQRLIQELRVPLMLALANLPTPAPCEASDIKSYLMGTLVLTVDGTLRFGGESLSCSQCGSTLPFGLDLEHWALRVPQWHLSRKASAGNPAPQDCRFPHGVGPHSVTLKIPSGKLVVANDLRRVLPPAVIDGNRPYIRDRSGGEASGINSQYGRKLNSEYWAGHGLLYFQCGNSSPSIFQALDGGVQFKHAYRCDPVSGEELDNAEPDERLVGSICTDLWAINAMDLEHFAACCTAQGLDWQTTLDTVDATVVTLPAGTYRATGFYEDDANLETGRYAELQRENQ